METRENRPDPISSEEQNRRIAELEAEVDRLRRYRNWYVAGELRLRSVKR
jgi:hypothetical protein